MAVYSQPNSYYMGDNSVCKINHRRAPNMAKLDFDVDIKHFKLWELQAEDFLAPWRPDIQQLLAYATTFGMPRTRHVESSLSTA